MQSRSRMISICAVLTAAGLILGYIESFLVIPVRIPGIRIGIANISTLVCLYLCGPGYAAAVLTGRILLSAMLFGSPVSLMYSLTGGVFAMIAMTLFRRFGFSIYGVSVTGAAFHNTGQIFAAFFLMDNHYVFYYLPALTLAGVVTGLVTGAVSAVIVKRIGHNLPVSEERG